jgi:hypothetical protein
MVEIVSNVYFVTVFLGSLGGSFLVLHICAVTKLTNSTIRTHREEQNHNRLAEAGGNLCLLYPFRAFREFFLHAYARS